MVTLYPREEMIPLIDLIVESIFLPYLLKKIENSRAPSINDAIDSVH